MAIPEREIQAKLYRFLSNVIDKKFRFGNIEFTEVLFERPNIDGFPDLVVYASEKGKKPIPLLVIETKRKVPYRTTRFDPWDRNVIAQAERYATWLGAPYFATCNGEILVLFETFKIGVPLPQRRVKDYKVSLDEDFARLILEEVGRFRTGIGKWLPLDDVFVQRLRSFHRFITPYIYRALIDKLREDLKFKEEYIRWLRSQLFEYSDEVNEKIAEQIAYLLMNKIIFYKTLETKISELPKLDRIEAKDGLEFSRKIREYFDRALDIDYEAIFEKTVLDEIPISSRLVETLNDFIEEIGTYNLARIRSDVLGRVYEDLIPEDERHRLGQYYTPPPIVDLIIELCVKSPNDVVLDPGCGSGSFLVKAYHKLRDLKKRENPFRSDAELHKEILNQIYGIDINPFPAQLSSINLAVRNLEVRSDNLNLIVSDFFKIKPGMFPLPKEFDVVVTNPPYTRQEEMEYKEQIREAALTYMDGSKIKLDARAGIYAYFFIHSAKFLKNGRRMGYITSNTWLDTKFGEGLKHFFLDHFKIVAIIEHDAGVFEKANVDTCIVILEKAEGDVFQEERRLNLVKFIRIKKSMEIKNLLPFMSADVDFENEIVRVHVQEQQKLLPEEKWGKYLRAPTVYYKITAHPKMTRMKEISNIQRGFTTGANVFFYLDRDKVNHWGIEEEYLFPIITSPRQAKACVIENKDINQYVLLIHEPKEALVNTNVLAYIEHGENVSLVIKRGKHKGQTIIGYHNVPMIRSRKLWYDLGTRKVAPLLFPCKIRKRCFFIWNKANAFVDKSFYEIHPAKETMSLILAGLLNSTLTMLLIELHGRLYGRGLLELEVYELENLPIVDIEKLKDEEKNRIKKAFLKLCEAQKCGDEKLERKARRDLDNAVFDVLGLSEEERKQVYDGLRSLRGMRLRRKKVDVLVETEEGWKPPKRRKKRREVPSEPTHRLDLWMRE